MKISQEDTILIKIYMCQRDRVRDKGWKLGSIDSLLNRIRKSGKISRQPLQQTAFGADTDENIQKLEDIVLSQKDKPKTNRSDREIVRKTKLTFLVQVCTG